MGNWESGTFTLCGVRDAQKQDCSVKMYQQEFTTKLSTAEHNLPKNLHRLNGKDKLDATGLTTLRGSMVHCSGWRPTLVLTYVLKYPYLRARLLIQQLAVCKRQIKSSDRPNAMKPYPSTYMRSPWTNLILVCLAMRHGESDLTAPPRVDF